MLQITELLQLLINTSSIQTLSENVNLISRSAQRYSDNMPPVVVWNINRRCNMTCPHCYASASLRPKFDGISTAEALSVVDKLKAYNVPILIFSGGEPLLRDDHLKLIQYATDQGITCHLSTNGTLITAKKAQELKSVGIGYVGISIDGEPEFNDSYRGLKDGYNLAMAGALNAKEAGLKVGIRMTVSAKNQEQLFSLLDEVIERGISRFYLSHLVYGGRGKGFSKYDLSKNQCRELMEQVFDRAITLIEEDKPIGIVSGGNDADGAFLHLYAKKRFGDSKADMILKLLEKRKGNSAGEKVINVDYKGNVHPDQFWQTSDCGNILNQSLADIFQSKLLVDLKNRTAYLKGKCAACAYINICRGSHRERALIKYDDLWQEDPACYLTKEEVDVSL